MEQMGGIGGPAEISHIERYAESQGYLIETNQLQVSCFKFRSAIRIGSSGGLSFRHEADYLSGGIGVECNFGMHLLKPCSSTRPAQLRAGLTALPEAEFVAVGIMKEGQETSDFLFNCGSFDAFRLEVSNRGLNIRYTKAEACIAGAFNRVYPTR